MTLFKCEDFGLHSPSESVGDKARQAKIVRGDAYFLPDSLTFHVYVTHHEMRQVRQHTFELLTLEKATPWRGFRKAILPNV
jgi:hypothetical protein